MGVGEYLLGENALEVLSPQLHKKSKKERLGHACLIPLIGQSHCWESRWGVCWHPRDLTLKTYLFLVDLFVLFEVGARAELLVTSLTRERLLTRVDALVPDQIRYLKANKTEIVSGCGSVYN